VSLTAGTTFAFDLETPAQQRAFIAQRLQRGFMNYPAGERTIRFRLNAAWSRRHLDDLFQRITPPPSSACTTLRPPSGAPKASSATSTTS
jgi:hypothetical protein